MREIHDKPNIILINCDDLGYGDLGCYGSDLNSTPHVDQLAIEGIRFTNFYMASPVCSPSRAAMLTGSYPLRVGIPEVLFPNSPIGLSPSESTIASVLRSNGYRTKIIGKWHLGDQEEFLPTRHGFEQYFGIPYSNDMGIMRGPRRRFPPLPLVRDETVIELQPTQEELTDRYTCEATSYIEEHRNEPFFLYLAHMHVHRPVLVAERFVEASRNGRYGAAVEAIDWSLGQIMDQLRELGLDSHTILIFTSDNGSIGGSNSPLRGNKNTTWEGGMKLPCIIRWLNQIRPNSESSSVITSLDFLPTIASITGSDLPKSRKIDGRNIDSILFSQVDEHPRETFFYYLRSTLCAVRSGKWKLHVVRVEQEGNRTIENHPVSELYDLDKDPGESTDLSDSFPDVVADLRRRLEECRVDLGDDSRDMVGENCRLPGRVSSPITLTNLNESDPVVWAEYDTDEIG